MSTREAIEVLVDRITTLATDLNFFRTRTEKLQEELRQSAETVTEAAKGRDYWKTRADNFEDQLQDERNLHAAIIVALDKERA